MQYEKKKARKKKKKKKIKRRKKKKRKKNEVQHSYQLTYNCYWWEKTKTKKI